MVILYDRPDPVETHSGTNEFGMIQEARPFEHSGRYFALLKGGSAMKQLILYTILLNVFVAPWGLSATTQAGNVGLATVALLGKAVVLGAVVVVIDNSFAKLCLQDHGIRCRGIHAGRARLRQPDPAGACRGPPYPGRVRQIGSGTTQAGPARTNGPTRRSHGQASPAEGWQVPHVGYTSDVIEMVEQFVYRPRCCARSRRWCGPPNGCSPGAWTLTWPTCTLPWSRP